MDDYSWWQRGIIYQIYPRSYKDTTGNGIGDLKGIYEKLDYIKSLGVECIWLSPIYPSPMHDFGYDVSDYMSIHPDFGSIQDFELLLDGIHNRGMKLMMDFVPNHTSSEHPWFKESRSSRDNPKRNWYIWKDPVEGSVPTNWTSHFGGPAWTFDENTGQYYMHQFLPEQPELNYEIKDMRREILSNMRFWLEKGVDGFRLDVIWLIKKDQRFLDEVLNPDWDGKIPWEKTERKFTGDVDGVFEYIKEYRSLLDEYEDRVFLGEIYLPFDRLVKYYGQEDLIQLPMNSVLLSINWDAETIKDSIRTYFSLLPDHAWPNWQLGNHDQHRVASRIGPRQARVANIFLLTIWGTPITYYGEEIGMVNGVIPKDRIRDPPAINIPDAADQIGRDPERTPMQWDSSANAGFTSHGVESWLPVAETYRSLNIEKQEEDPRSMLQLYKQLTTLRLNEPSLSVGLYTELSIHQDVIAFTRAHPSNDPFLILLNIGSDHHHLDLSSLSDIGHVEISSHMDRIGEVSFSDIELRRDEGLVLRF